MKAFVDLYNSLDETTKTLNKVQALVRYFAQAQAADAAWAVYFLAGNKIRQVVPTRKLAEWATALTDVPAWLFEECHQAVGDLAEAIALLLPAPRKPTDRPLHQWVEEHLIPMRTLGEGDQRAALLAAWDALEGRQRFVWNKLITGSFRVGVSRQLLTRSLAEVSGVDVEVMAHRLMGTWSPTPAAYDALLAPNKGGEDHGKPYPFFLASPLDGSAAELGSVQDWQAEWKWDGIRSQLIRRRGEVFLWSRGEELITERFPEISEVASRLPEGTVLDGEVLPWRNGVLPFAQLQRRIGRKTVGKKLLAEVPVVLMAYDLLEFEGRDLRESPLRQRRAMLEDLIRRTASERLIISPLVPGTDWAEWERARANSREQNVEGLMLKRLDSPYRTGRVRGDWWKWKVVPLTVDAVLVYAQGGSGKRASLYTDYTFAVWEQGELLPFAKAYSGLTDEEIRKVNAFVRANTTEKFGPVRSVKPELVFELAFEGIQRSPRHKSGIAVRFPRILRWRTDKTAAEADSLDRIKAMLPPEEPGLVSKDAADAPDVHVFRQGELFG